MCRARRTRPAAPCPTKPSRRHGGSRRAPRTSDARGGARTDQARTRPAGRSPQRPSRQGARRRRRCASAGPNAARRGRRHRPTAPAARSSDRRPRSAPLRASPGTRRASCLLLVSPPAGSHARCVPHAVRGSRLAIPAARSRPLRALDQIAARAKRLPVRRLGCAARAHRLDVIGVPAGQQRHPARRAVPARGEEQGHPSRVTKAAHGHRA